MTLLKTTALALVIAAAPASAFACEWMSAKSDTSSYATPVTIGSATVPNATPVDAETLSTPIIEVESVAEDTPETEDLSAE